MCGKELSLDMVFPSGLETGSRAQPGECALAISVSMPTCYARASQEQFEVGFSEEKGGRLESGRWEVKLGAAQFQSSLGADCPGAAQLCSVRCQCILHQPLIPSALSYGPVAFQTRPMGSWRIL